MSWSRKSRREEGLGGCWWHVGDVGETAVKAERLKNPSLTHVGHFLFSLYPAKEGPWSWRRLLAVWYQQRSASSEIHTDAPWEKSFSVMDTKEVLGCLYESQEEQLVKDAMARSRCPFT